MSDPATPPEANGRTVSDPLEWRVEPWRDFPARAGAGLLAAIALGILAVRMSPAPLAGWALAIVLLVVLGPSFLPVQCRVDAEGLGRRVGWGWERRGWEQIRRARLTPEGLYVSTLLHDGPLEPFRGMLLPLPRAAAQELRAALSSRLSSHGV